MGLFDLFKGNKDGKNPVQKSGNDSERFEKELFAVIPRYFSKPGVTAELVFRDPETKNVVPFSVVFEESFNEWRGVKSAADRRGILYSILDQHLGNKLELWQVIERYTDDRYPQKALQIAMEHKSDEDEQDVEFWNALAKTYLILTQYHEAEACCKKALTLDAKSIRAKRVLADLYHCTNKHQPAHALYEEILKEKLPADQPITLELQKLLGFDGDIVNSPIYAANWLKSDKNVTPEVWDWASEEFYYSPHFRAQHAYELIKKGEQLRGFAKLHALSKEMPWYKEAVMNTVSLIDQLNLGSQMEEDKQKFLEIIRKNNWTNDNMNSMNL